MYREHLGGLLSSQDRLASMSAFRTLRESYWCFVYTADRGFSTRTME